MDFMTFRGQGRLFGGSGRHGVRERLVVQYNGNADAGTAELYAGTTNTAGFQRNQDTKAWAYREAEKGWEALTAFFAPTYCCTYS